MRKTRYTVEQCFEEAKKFDRRAKFFKGNQCAYAMLQRAGLLNEACGHMQISDLYSLVRWTKDTVFTEALKYKSRAEFKRENQGAYGYALKNNILHIACAHMRSGQNIWHMFEIMAVALKYTDQRDFMRQEKSAYNYVNKHKLDKIVFSHMNRNRNVWTKELVLAEAAKHQTRSMFFAMASGAYKHALANNYVDEVFAHMDIKKRDHTKEGVMEIAQQFQTRTEFQCGDGGAYVFARVNGFLDEACAHMLQGEGGFSPVKQAILYHLRITLPEDVVVYKIGITNRTPERRIAGLGLPAGASAEVLGSIIFPSGRDARIAEKRLHRRLAAYRYKGVPPLKNGNTELFTVAAFEH